MVITHRLEKTCKLYHDAKAFLLLYPISDWYFKWLQNIKSIKIKLGNFVFD